MSFSGEVFLQSGTHTIGASHLGKVVFCDCNTFNSNVGINLELDTTTQDLADGDVRIVRLEENGDDSASYLKVYPESGTLSNFDFLVLPIENDWLEVRHSNGKWRVTGGGQVPMKGPGGQHRTPDSTTYYNKIYEIHEGDRGAVIRVNTGTPGGTPGPYPVGAMQVYLPTAAQIGRTGDYAGSFRVGVMMTANPNYSNVTVNGNGAVIGGSATLAITIPGRIIWFDFDGNQWFPELQPF